MLLAICSYLFRFSSQLCRFCFERIYVHSLFSKNKLISCHQWARIIFYVLRCHLLKGHNKTNSNRFEIIFQKWYHLFCFRFRHEKRNFFSWCKIFFVSYVPTQVKTERLLQVHRICDSPGWALHSVVKDRFFFSYQTTIKRFSFSCQATVKLYFGIFGILLVVYYLLV